MSSLLQRFLSSSPDVAPFDPVYFTESSKFNTLDPPTPSWARCANHPTVIEVPVEVARYWLLTGQRNSLLREPTRLCPPSFFLPPPVAFQFPGVLLATKFNHRPNFSSSSGVFLAFLLCHRRVTPFLSPLFSSPFSRLPSPNGWWSFEATSRTFR